MIAFAKDFLRLRGKRRIPLPDPVCTIVITGARRERIDAVIGPDRRLLHMIVHTRWRSSRYRYQL